MTRLVIDPRWTEGQREFIANLEQAGATNAQRAVAIDRTMALPTRELQALVDSGVVREATANRYYVYVRQPREERQVIATAELPEPPAPFNSRKFVKMIVFWIIVILIPIVLLQLLGTPRK